MDTVIIGSGNVATVFGRKLFAAGHKICQVFSRNEMHAQTLAASLNAGFTCNKNKIDQTAGFYLIALSDHAIPLFADGLSLNHGLVVHTAGSVSKEILQSVSLHYGVMYPLQSLRSDLPAWPPFTMLVDANGPEDLEMVMQIAADLTTEYRVAGDAERLKYHLAAVVVNNFSNHLFTLAADFCKKEGLNFQLLLPLMQETVSRLAAAEPEKVQTGPAVREDTVTIERHLALLKDYPQLRHFYQLFTDSIQYFHI